MAEVSGDRGSERPAGSGIRRSIRATPRLARLRQTCASEALAIAKADLRFQAALLQREAGVNLKASSTRDPL